MASLGAPWLWPRLAALLCGVQCTGECGVMPGSICHRITLRGGRRSQGQ